MTPTLSIGPRHNNRGDNGAVTVRERKRLGLMAHDQHALWYRGVMELAWAMAD